MGCGNSAPTDADPNDAANAAVEAQLLAMQEAEENEFKILLLGAGESGKSTVVKQVKIIFKGNVSKKEKEEYTVAIGRNCMESIQTLLEAMKVREWCHTQQAYKPTQASKQAPHTSKQALSSLPFLTLASLLQTLKIPFSDASLIPLGAKFEELDSDALLSEEMSYEIEKLWTDPGCKATYERRSEYVQEGSEWRLESEWRQASEHQPDASIAIFRWHSYFTLALLCHAALLLNLREPRIPSRAVHLLARALFLSSLLSLTLAPLAGSGFWTPLTTILTTS